MSDSKHKDRLLERHNDFDYWMDLAKRDPQCFEEHRARFLDEYIASSPRDKQEHLRRVQWRVDQSRRLAKNPVDAMNRVSKLMWEELIRLNGYQKKLVAMATGNLCTETFAQAKEATILVFPGKKVSK